jgi:Spy/CpxP family protein refolding chaperone
MKIWKPVLTLALGAVLSLGAFAQQAGPQGGGVSGGTQGGAAGRPGGFKGMQKIEEEIWAKITPPLTADQRNKLTSINQKMKASFKALRGKAQSGDKGALRDEVQKLMKERRESVAAILTPEQKTSYEKLIKDALEKYRSQNGKGGKKSGKKGGIG